MFAYIVRRILQAIAVVFVISIVVFILVRCLPGDPIEMYVSQAGLTEITPEMIEEIRHDKGLDRPWVVQYVDWLGQMLRGDFGVSIMRNFNIANEMQNRVTVTLLIGLTAFLIGLVVAPPAWNNQRHTKRQIC